MTFYFNVKFLIYKLYRQLKRKFKPSIRTEFENRIIKRWEVFWRDAIDLHLIKEKLNRHDSIEIWTNIENWQRRLENKYNAKQFALKFECKVAKVYWQGREEEFKIFDLATLPQCYTIKPILGECTKDVFLMRNGYNLFNSSYYTFDQLRNEINDLFELNIGIEILIEEFLPDEAGNFVVPNDYRFFAFNGEILFIQLDKRSGIKKEQVSFYTPKWELIKNKILIDVTTKVYDEPPACLNEMIQDVRRLSKIYKSFVRIDFYASINGPVFGEFTATPRKGKETTAFGSREIIRMWDRHCKGLI